MKKKHLFAALFFLLAIYSQALTDEQVAADRAMALTTAYAERNLALSRQEWPKQIVPEFFHPQRNDSGLSWVGPTTLPALPEVQGVFITTGYKMIGIYQGTQPILLKNNDPVYFIKVRYTVIGGGKAAERLVLFEEPRIQEEYITMALDHRDGKWKWLDCRPLSAKCHSISSVLANWKRFSGQFKDYGDFDKIFEKLKALEKKAVTQKPSLKGRAFKEIGRSSSLPAEWRKVWNDDYSGW